MSILGISPLGTQLGPYGGPGLITVKSLIVTGRRTFALILDRIPRYQKDGVAWDAGEVANYLFEGFDPTELDQNGNEFVPAGKVVPSRAPVLVKVERDEADPTQLLGTLDVSLDPRAEYDLTILTLVGRDGETFAGPNAWRFSAIHPAAVPLVREALRPEQDPLEDFANGALPVGVTDEQQGWKKAKNGLGFERHGGVDSLRKRIYRIIIAGGTELSILGPNFGADLVIKAQATPRQLQVWCNRIREGCLRQPDVQEVVVYVQRPTDGTSAVDVMVSVAYLSGKTGEYQYRLPEASP